MSADLPSCEWHPGLNRSVVSIEQAVAKLHLVPDDAKRLIEKFNQHIPDDLVLIDKSNVHSFAGYKYGPDISRMNFGKGRLCTKVTRLTWKNKEQQEAIVFVVNGKAYGYAAACGNLFELRLIPRAPVTHPPLMVENTEELPAVLEVVDTSIALEQPVFETPTSEVVEDTTTAWAGPSSVNVSVPEPYSPEPPAPPISSIPEPTTGAFLAACLPVIYLVSKRRT
jgi:hypothetical protein